MDGYSKLAALMGTYPDAMILRRFGALHAQNILYLQAELVHLEQEFRICTTANQGSEDPMKNNFIGKDWFVLAHLNDGNEQQWQLMLQIRSKLKEYGSRSIHSEYDAQCESDLSQMRQSYSIACSSSSMSQSPKTSTSSKNG